MLYLNIAVVVFIAAFTVYGISRGFIRQTISLFGFITAVAVATIYYDDVYDYIIANTPVVNVLNYRLAALTGLNASPVVSYASETVIGRLADGYVERVVTAVIIEPIIKGVSYLIILAAVKLAFYLTEKFVFATLPDSIGFINEVAGGVLGLIKALTIVYILKILIIG